MDTSKGYYPPFETCPSNRGRITSIVATQNYDLACDVIQNDTYVTAIKGVDAENAAWVARLHQYDEIRSGRNRPVEAVISCAMSCSAEVDCNDPDYTSCARFLKRDLRLHTYTSIIHGAQGIWYWSYSSTYNMCDSKNACVRYVPPVGEDASYFQDNLVPLSNELKDLTPFLLGSFMGRYTWGVSEGVVPTCSDAAIHLLLMRKDEDVIVIAANTTGSPKSTVTLNFNTIASAPETDILRNALVARVLYDSSQEVVELDDGILQHSFEPWEVHVYRFREVRVPADALTLQAAMALSEAGDVVLVTAGGTYSGPLVVNTGVSIKAAVPGVILDASDSSVAVSIPDLRLPGTGVSGLTIQNFSSTGVLVDAGGGFKSGFVENCSITGGQSGVVMHHNSSVMVNNSTIRNQSSYGIQVENSNPTLNAIVRIIDNLIVSSQQGSNKGIALETFNAATTNIIEGNTVSGWTTGIQLLNGNIQIRRNLVTGNGTGIECYNGNPTVIEMNNSWGNTYTSYPYCSASPPSNNLSVDPRLCSAVDFTLNLTSPCARFGNDWGVWIGARKYVSCASGVLSRNVSLVSSDVQDNAVTLTSDLEIQATKNLTIGRGLCFLADNTAEAVLSSGIDAAKNEIIVHGQLQTDAPVAFTSTVSSSNPGYWFGIVVKNGGSALLDSASIVNSVYGLYCPDLAQTVTLTDCNILDFSSTGIRVDNSGPGGAATDLLVSGGSIDVSSGLQGVYVLKAATAVVEKVAITGDNNSWYGVYLDAAPGGNSHYEVNDCSISGFSTGTGVYVNDHAPFVRGNTIAGCKWGVQLRGGFVPRVETNPETEQETTISLCTTGIYTLANAFVDEAQITSPSGGTGLYLDQGSHGTYSHLNITNGAVGVQASTSTLPTILRYSSVTQFTSNGVKYGVMGLNLGAAPDSGNNNIHSTVSGTGKYVYMKICPDGGATIRAEYNYWGTSTPDAAKFSSCVDYTPYLTSLASATMLNPVSLNILPIKTGLRAEPNPFRGDVRLSFVVAEEGQISDLQVFDVTGRLVQVLASGPLAAGEYTVAWDGRTASGLNVPRGLYFVRLRAGEVTTTLKIVRIQ